MTELYELFAPPFRLKQVATLDGIKIFSSDKTVKKFKMMLEKTGRMRPYVKDLNDLVDRGVIIPSFLSKGVVSFLASKILGYNRGNAYALYYRPHKKVYVFIDAEMTSWGTAENDELLSTTVHECMHVFADTQSSKYMSVFKGVLIDYYSEVFKECFQLKSVSKKDVFDVIKLMRKQARSNRPLNKNLADLYYFLQKKFESSSELEKNQFLQRLQDYIVVAKIGAMNVPTSILQKTFNERKHVFMSLYNGYYRAFGKRPKIFGQMQEGVFTSEVASIFAELYPTHSIVRKAIASI